MYVCMYVCMCVYIYIYRDINSPGEVVVLRRVEAVRRIQVEDHPVRSEHREVERDAQRTKGRQAAAKSRPRTSPWLPVHKVGGVVQGGGVSQLSDRGSEWSPSLRERA